MATEEEKHDELRQKYMELQMFSEQIKQFQQQAQMLEEQFGELNITLHGLIDLQKTKKDKEILVPIATGIFAKAKLVEDKDLIVNVGSNVLIRKDIKTTINMTQERINSVEQYQLSTIENLQKLSSRAQELDQELTELAENIKKE